MCGFFKYNVRETCNCGTVPARPTWDQFFFGLAEAYRLRSTCARAQIACIIVDPAMHKPVGFGYNGAMSGEPHCTDVGCLMMPGVDHCLRAIHAEDNATRGLPHYRDEDDHPLIAYVVGNRPVCGDCGKKLWRVGVGEVRTPDAI
jgi:deoxycytidylate deaminase